MKKSLVVAMMAVVWCAAKAANRIYDPQVKSLQAVVNQDWLSPAVMRLNSDDLLHVSFDELSHDYHRYICHIERCEADWSTSDEVFESDWLEGFNDNVIDDYEGSVNTTVLYTHYSLTLPNDRCRLKMSGNYRLHVVEDGSQDDILTVEFMLTEQAVQLSMAISSNTDIDTNLSHQQLTMGLKYGNLPVTYPSEQIQTVVMQNGREDTWRRNSKPSYESQNGLEWRHVRDFIFDGGNEYRKFEVLDPSHPTMGIDYIRWDGDYYQVFPFVDEPRPNYIYDEDADGAFYIRNSDNYENDTSSDYVWVNYRLRTDAHLSSAEGIYIHGQWTSEDPETYRMELDEETGLYTASVLQKQGYYNYQYVIAGADGHACRLHSEGNFYQTENRYQALVYYKGTGGRTWRLVGYGQVTLR